MSSDSFYKYMFFYTCTNFQHYFYTGGRSFTTISVLPTKKEIETLVIRDNINKKMFHYKQSSHGQL